MRTFERKAKYFELHYEIVYGKVQNNFHSLDMASTSGGSVTRGSSASLISESQNEDDQETEESETERAVKRRSQKSFVQTCGTSSQRCLVERRCCVDCATTNTLTLEQQVT